MNYDEEVQQIIDAIKADKSITSEWRYKAIARLKECRAYIHEGKLATNRKPPEDLLAMESASPCICTLGMPPRKDCLVHGAKE